MAVLIIRMRLGNIFTYPVNISPQIKKKTETAFPLKKTQENPGSSHFSISSNHTRGYATIEQEIYVSHTACQTCLRWGL